MYVRNTPLGVRGQFASMPLTMSSLIAGPKRLPVWTVEFVYWMFVCGDAEGSKAALVALVALVAAMVEVLVWGREMLVALVAATDKVLVLGSEMLLLFVAGSYAPGSSFGRGFYTPCSYALGSYVQAASHF